MRFIPPNRGYQATLRRLLCEHYPAFIAGFRPMPTGPYAEGYRLGLRGIRDVISGETEVMRALPRSRFRNTFREQAVLPLSASVSLEDFELELRRVNLIADGELLVQSLSSPRKFRVAIREVSDNDVTHCERPPSLPVRPSAPNVLRLCRNRRSMF